MKTSVTLPASLYRELKKASLKTEKGLGEILVLWATRGRSIEKQKNATEKFKPVDLGKPKISLLSRSEIYDTLEEEYSNK